MADISHIKGPDNTSYDIKDATARSDISNLATVASTGSYNDLLNKPTVAEIDDNSTANNKAWSASNINSKLTDPVTFRTDDIPEEAANLGNTATVHRITAYRNGLSIPYRGENTNDGGILRVRGKTESDCILELGTWDDSGTGETIQFNYYPTTSQVTPTYSVSVPKKSGTIALTSDVDGKVSKSGDTMSNTLAFSNGTRNIEVPNRSISYVAGAQGNAGLYCKKEYNKDNWYPAVCLQTKGGGSWQMGNYSDEKLQLVYFPKDKIDSGTNNGQTIWNISSGNGWEGKWAGITLEMNTNNTTDTWVPVQTGSKWQHRVIPRTIDGTSSVSFTRSHASVSYKEGLVCNRFGNVVTFAGYFACGATIAANTVLYSGLPKPAGGKAIYFTWSGYDFYLHATDGTIRTNGQIVPRTYVGTFTYVCA